tara:strand:+ start:25470 stop:25643 length:174 start_codon:yes stop_codon:yes gene_type:complete
MKTQVEIIPTIQPMSDEKRAMLVKEGQDELKRQHIDLAERCPRLVEAGILALPKKDS